MLVSILAFCFLLANAHASVTVPAYIDTSVKTAVDTGAYPTLPLIVMATPALMKIVDAPMNATVHAYEMRNSAHEDESCLQLATANESAAPFSASHHVHATATILKAYPMAHMPVRTPFVLTGSDNNCSSAVLFTASPLTDSLRVGGIAQLYHLETQAAVAEFQGTLPPWLVPVASALAVLLYHLARSCRATGRTSAVFSASSASKHSVAICMVAGATQVALELGGVDGDAVKVGTIATQLVVAVVTMLTSVSSWAVLQGSSSVSQCAKSLMASLGAFATTGNVAAASALVQPLFATCRRQGMPAAYVPSDGFQGNRRTNTIITQRP